MAKVSWPAVLLVCPALLVAQQHLDLRPGLWKITSVTEQSGQPPVPQAVLDSLTPEQRAQLEARMKASAGHKATEVTEHCYTQAEIDKPTLDLPNNKACALTGVKSTSSVQDVTMNCDQGQMKTSGSVHFEAMDREHLKGTVKMSMTSGPRTMNINTSLTGVWLSPTCSAADNH